MKLILRQATIIDPSSDWHQKVADIRISGDTIEAIGKKLDNPGKYQDVTLKNLHVSAGWFDTSVSLGEPGFEERENIDNGLQVAAKSGFTGIALQPNGFPVADSQQAIRFVREKAGQSATSLYPIGALTKNSEGKDLAELFDMKNAGAVAFGDYNKNIDNPNLLKIALQYTQDFDGLVVAFAQDAQLKGSGVANEGIAATKLGLKGIPALAEEIQIARNLFLLEYTGGRLHIPTVSTPKSVQLVKEAKSKGLRVTCSVAAHHLVLTDDKLEGFDTRYKVSPPLRSEADRKALVKAVKDGTIDCITSDHNPIDIEHKKMEFDLAKNGTIGLESIFGALMTVLPLETVIEKLTAGRNIFGIAPTSITTGASTNLTLFNPDETWVFGKEHVASKSKNSAFLGSKMAGRAYGIYNNNKLIL